MSWTYDGMYFWDYGNAFLKEAGDAVVNILIVGFCFKPEFVGVRKEYQTEHQEKNYKSEGRLGGS